MFEIKDTISNNAYTYAMLSILGRIRVSDNYFIETGIKEIKKNFIDNGIIELKSLNQCKNTYDLATFVEYECMKKIAGFMPSENHKLYDDTVEEYNNRTLNIEKFMNKFSDLTKSNDCCSNKVKVFLDDVIDYVKEWLNQDVQEKILGDFTSLMIEDTSDKDNYRKLNEDFICIMKEYIL